MKKLISVVFLVVFIGITNNASASVADVYYDATTKKIVNMSNDVLRYYPSTWPTTSQDIANPTIDMTLIEFISYVRSIAVTPQIAMASEENHDPLNVFLYYSQNICDDSARFAHQIANLTGRESRLLILNGHVAMEIYDEGKWKFVDTYGGFYSDLSYQEIKALGVNDKFDITYVKSGLVSSVSRTVFPFSEIGDDDTFATERTPFFVRDDAFTMLPEDELYIEPISYLPYRIVPNSSSEAHAYYSQLTLKRNVANGDMIDKRKMQVVDHYNEISLDQATKTYSYKGLNSSFTSYFNLPSPIIGVTLNFDSLGLNNGKLYANVIDLDTNTSLVGGLYEITGNISNLQFNTYRPGGKEKAVRNIRVTVAYIGNHTSSTATVKNPVISVHSMVTPKAKELFEAQF